MKLSVRGDTDTAHPQDSVPIYFIHTIQTPFCNRPACWCRTHQVPIAQLLEAANKGEKLLREVATFGESR